MSKVRKFVLAGMVMAAGVIAVAVSVWPQVGGLDPSNPKVTLADIEATVAQTYRVPEITSESLPSLAKDTVLFDVREVDEFARSHIAGATRIDPGMSAEDFSARYGAEIKGRPVVFYCAVGVRSSTMLARLRSVLPGMGVSRAYSLRGGIFRWHVAGGPLVSQSGPALDVHHYDSAWKGLLDRTLSARVPSGANLR